MRESRPEILFVHGLWMHGCVFALHRRRLRAMGWRSHASSYPSLRGSLAGAADGLAAFIAELDGRPLHRVGQSLGGCVVLDMLDALTAAIAGAVQIAGSDDADLKERRLHDFAHGKIRVLVSKPSICGFGLNCQHCAHMAFVGVTDSFEAYYQAVRRCWRFGQKRPVDVHIFASQQEGAVVANLRRKEAAAKEMSDAMAAETMDAVRENILGRSKDTNPYQPAARMSLPDFMRAA